MAFEAYHTARCRRDGLPLPNPFGLNDLGHKLGFDQILAHATLPVAPAPPDPYVRRLRHRSPPSRQPPEAIPPRLRSAVPTTQVPPAQHNQAGPCSVGSGLGAVQPRYAANASRHRPAWISPARISSARRSKFLTPATASLPGAIWLIGLGAIFLVFNAGIHARGISGRHIPSHPAHGA